MVEKLKNRDWRDLRKQFLGLEMTDRSRVADWLTNAGYTPNQVDPGWSPDQVDDDLVSVLESHREILRWLMTLKIDLFKRAVVSAHRYFDELREIQGVRLEERHKHTEARLIDSRFTVSVLGYTPARFRPPEKTFAASTSFPADFDPWLLCMYLMGTGVAPTLRSLFWWDANGSPTVSASVETPLEAIGLSVHVDRNFSARQWVNCANEACRRLHERDRGVGRFCGDRCRNLCLTRARRAKVRLVKEGEQA